MQLFRGFALITLASITLAAPGLAHAATADCMNDHGECEVSNDGFDTVDCTCTDGGGGGGGGGMEWAGLTEGELLPVCQEQLEMFCGPFVPPEEIQCFGILGMCTIDNEPEDLLACECYDGTIGGVAGGAMWAGYSDADLFAECEAQLDAICPPPPGSLTCHNTEGECTIANVPQDFISCECDGLGGGGYSGGAMWAGYTELELHEECAAWLVGDCGGPLPAPPWVECESTLGSCTIDNDPESVLDCTCADGQMFSGGEGKDWSELSEEELFSVCEEELYEGCFVPEGSDTGDSGDSGDTDDSADTTAGDSTGEPGTATGPNNSDSSGGTPPPNTTGDEPGTDSSGGDSTAGATDGDSGCSCSANESTPHGWALVLLGLVGWTRRRRRVSQRR